MLEGLKSDSSSIRQFVQSWVTFAVARDDDLQILIEPLVKILASPSQLRRPILDPDSEKYRVGMEFSQTDAEKDRAYAKYYYSSLGIPDPMDFAKSGQHCETTCHYSQVIDSKQLLYALSLLRSTIEVDPPSIIGRMSATLVEATSYGQSSCKMSPDDSVVKEDGAASKKTLLEMVISLCVDLMRSEYPSSLEASLSNHLENLSVRILSVELLTALIRHLVRLSGHHQYINASSLSSSFVSALVTLCDVQKSALLILGRVVKDLRGFVKKDKDQPWSTLLNKAHHSSDPEFTLQSFFTQLLMLVYSLVALETQYHSKHSPTVATPTSRPALATPTTLRPALATPTSSSGLSTATGEWLPPVVSSLPTASQPFLHSLVMDVLSDSLLTHLHSSLLQFTAALLPNLMDQQLAELAAKLLKQICYNLENISPTTPKGKRSNGRLVILYLSSLCSILSWCMYGEIEPTSLDQEWVTVRTLTPYWNQLLVTETLEEDDRLSPTSRAPSTMSWLLSVFSTSSQMSKTLSGSEVNDGGSTGFTRSRVGVNSRAGQHMLMLLPAVYNVVTQVWRGYGLRGNEAELGGHASSIMGDVSKRKFSLEAQVCVCVCEYRIVGCY